MKRGGEDVRVCFCMRPGYACWQARHSFFFHGKSAQAGMSQRLYKEHRQGEQEEEIPNSSRKLPLKAAVELSTPSSGCSATYTSLRRSTRVRQGRGEKGRRDEEEEGVEWTRHLGEATRELPPLPATFLRPSFRFWRILANRLLRISGDQHR
jgi:hypothetical protein